MNNAECLAARIVAEEVAVIVREFLPTDEDVKRAAIKAAKRIYATYLNRDMFGCHCDDDAIPTLHVSDSARVVYLDGSKR